MSSLADQVRGHSSVVKYNLLCRIPPRKGYQLHMVLRRRSIVPREESIFGCVGCSEIHLLSINDDIKCPIVSPV